MLQSIKIFVEKKIFGWLPSPSPQAPNSSNRSWFFPANSKQSYQVLETGRSWSVSAQGSPPTFDWAEQIQQDQLENLRRNSAREAKQQTLSSDAQLKRLSHLLLLALRSGNISLAMMLFSHLESRSANEVTRCLMEKTQNLQEHKRQLSLQIQGQKNDADGSKNIQKIKTDMEQANDDIGVLQTFIRDVAQNKQQSIELANAFLSKEHETTMSILRSWGR